MSERYNAFISYAWRDNEPFDEGGKGWVSTFVNRLQKLLKRELSREMAKAPIWLDYEQMRGNDSVSDTIRAKVEASQLLIPIISRGYLESPWCTQEREIFINRHGADSWRIFPVWMQSVDNLPPELDSLLKYKFWYMDDRNRPRTRWFPIEDPTDREYGLLMQDIAQDMAKCLESIQADGPACQTAVSVNHHKVLVCGGEEDAELVRSLTGCLDSRLGIGATAPISVLQNQQKLKSSDISRDLRKKLMHCKAFLVVINNGPKDQIVQHINEYLKITPQRPKGLPPAALHICHPANKKVSFSIDIPQMHLHPCRDDCVEECAQQFAERLAAS